MAKIAIISTMSGSAWGGSEYLWATMAKQALIEGHEVLISLYDWSIEHPIVAQLNHQGAHLFPRPRFSNSKFLTSRVVRKLNQCLSLFRVQANQSFYQPVFDLKPDVICISQGSSYDAIHAPDLLNLLNSSSIPYVIVCQFNSDIYFLNSAKQAVAKKFFTQATCAAFVAEQNLRLAERQLAQRLPNAVVVQNPVNMRDFSLLPYPQQSKVCFAIVARLEAAFKGQDVLLEALSSPVWQARDWQCNFYGSGPDKDYLEALAKHYGISKRVTLVGQVSDVRSIWAENHLLILPSRGEGTPLSLVEAMLCGRPAVVTDVGGNTSWIEEPNTGFIAEASTVRSLSAALERAWLAQNNWQEMGSKAHQYAASRFDQSPGKTLLKLVLSAAKN